MRLSTKAVDASGADSNVCTMIRLGVLASHPIQYQAPLYRELASREDVTLKVWFSNHFGVEERVDPGFGEKIKWDIPLLAGYEHEFLPTVIKEQSPSAFAAAISPAMISRVRSFRPDAVVVHGYAHFNEVMLQLLAPALRIPILLRGESNLLTPRPRWKEITKEMLLRPLFRLPAGFLAIGTRNREYLEHYGVPPHKLFHAPYTVDNTFFSGPQLQVDALAWRSEHGIPADAQVVVTSAKLMQRKGVRELLEAFATVDAELSGSASQKGAACARYLVFIGTGPLEQELKARAKELGANVVFLGFVNQSRMPAAYALGDVFVLASYDEPWGLAVNEAMAVGLPVIVTEEVGSAVDLVGADNGWRIPPHDLGALRDALKNALSSPARLREMGHASKMRMQRWGIPQTADGYLEAARAVKRA
jgi:glycosyltransferase involved in cell wall biosynthesis